MGSAIVISICNQHGFFFFLTFTDISCSTQADKQACRWRTGKGGSITDRTKHNKTLIITTDGCLAHLVFWGDASTTEGRGSAFFLHPKQCVCALWAADTVFSLGSIRLTACFEWYRRVWWEAETQRPTGGESFRRAEQSRAGGCVCRRGPMQQMHVALASLQADERESEAFNLTLW